jgi:uncharacterized membrane protein YfhO
VAPAEVDLATVEPPTEPGGATVRGSGSSALQIDVQAPEAGYLVLSEFWYPGWQATVNGAPVAPEAANGAFMAVPIPAGASTVDLRFWPATFTWGLVAAGLGVLMIVGLFLLGRTRRQGENKLSTANRQ